MRGGAGRRGMEWKGWLLQDRWEEGYGRGKGGGKERNGVEGVVVSRPGLV